MLEQIVALIVGYLAVTAFAAVVVFIPYMLVFYISARGYAQDCGVIDAQYGLKPSTRHHTTHAKVYRKAYDKEVQRLARVTHRAETQRITAA